ncbi:MAG: hypothetical protein KKC85_10050 [Gammaproteobacteria bacterium]|nr:hypothetical protein [Gammaproteobacteria bacterium]MBU2286764.1 hypothetical protein [Gammaproteobacteria bacterium]
MAPRATATGEKRRMATYEKIVRETDRFSAADSEGKSWTVVEQTTFEARVGFVAKPHPPVELSRAYSLADGQALMARGRGEFQTQDGRLRLTRTGGERASSDMAHAPEASDAPQTDDAFSGRSG